MKKLVVVDDEKNIIEIIRSYFEDNGYTVIGAENAENALALLAEEPDLILLDIMMPGLNGIEFCREIRQQTPCPIIFLSARTEEASKITGLSAGGDDYITKPFSIRELYARVEAHLRRERRPRSEKNQIQFGPMWIDYGRNEIGVGNEIISLTKKEYQILELLSLNIGQVFTHDRIYEAIWGYNTEGDARSAIMEHIKRIRKKLQSHDAGQPIETVWGIGYKWTK